MYFRFYGWCHMCTYEDMSLYHCRWMTSLRQIRSLDISAINWSDKQVIAMYCTSQMSSDAQAGSMFTRIQSSVCNATNQRWSSSAGFRRRQPAYVTPVFKTDAIVVYESGYVLILDIVVIPSSRKEVRWTVSRWQLSFLLAFVLDYIAVSSNH